MKKAILSGSPNLTLSALSEVTITYDHGAQWQFEIVPHAGKVGKALVSNHMLAEICAAGSEYFAVFSTDLGKVTYIFCDNGRGYKIGPGVLQKDFYWE